MVAVRRAMTAWRGAGSEVFDDSRCVLRWLSAAERFRGRIFAHIRRWIIEGF